MNFDEYQTTYFSVYQSFADTVRSILEHALRDAKELPRPQAIQSRAKGLDRLRRRLIEENKLDTQTLESVRRDLAGARLIFYTNNDVDRFMSSGIIWSNFDVEEDSTKVHHPTPENKGAQYRAFHYTVRLGEDRIRLPEYKRFAGLRCEIQVQTILNHAYSETSHDIIYKGQIGGGGFGAKAMEAITRRFDRIADKYLIPAGYEIQKAQREYERLLQGKELFDKDIGGLLDTATNNNERYAILSELKDYAIPNYDDLPAAFQGLKGPLLATVRAARNTGPVPIETPFGNTDGFKADTVIGLVVEIIERIRYADITGTLQLLVDIFREEIDEDIRQNIVNVVKRLAEHDIDAYRQVGPGIQMALINHLAAMSDAEIDRVRPIAIAVWAEAIQSDITGTKWRADSVMLSSGAVPLSEQLKEIRDKAIQALFAAYDRSTDDAQRRAILSALDAATRTPSPAQHSNELRATTLKDSRRIVDFARARAKTMSFALLQHLEHKFLYDYFRAKGFAEDRENRFGCQDEAKALVSSILAFRDTVNSDAAFVRYKVLVGFESVYPEHWVNENVDFHSDEQYRRAEADRYIVDIGAANEAGWFDVIERCAETKSDDLATFPVFGNFISNLAERKPEVADRLLTRASDDLRAFLAGFLNGFVRSGRREIYDRVFGVELQSARNLAGVARHIRYSDVAAADLAGSVLARAIEKEHVPAVVECLLFALEHYEAERIPAPDEFVGHALDFLNKHKNSSWVWNAWFLQNVSKFYESLTQERLAKILENLGYLRKIDHQSERILVRLAQRWPEEIWDFFGKRLDRDVEEGEERFEAVPFSFHGLEKELSKNPQLGIKKGMTWFGRNSELFEFRGGRLLSSAFPNCTPEFATALAELVKTGGETEADFALQTLRNYEGETSTHVVLKEVVSKFSEDKYRMSMVGICIDSTGVVSGELGFAQAWRARKETMAEWLADDRPVVRAFAEQHIRTLDLRIAEEHRRAEANKEMRHRDYEDTDNDDKPEEGPTEDV